MAASQGTPMTYLGTVAAFDPDTGANTVTFLPTGWARDLRVVTSALPLAVGDQVVCVDGVIMGKVARW